MGKAPASAGATRHSQADSPRVAGWKGMRVRFTAWLIGGMALGAGLCGCAQQVAANQPSPLAKIGGTDELARRLAKDPVEVLQEGLDRYNRDVASYTCTLYKQERIDPRGPMGPRQKMVCKFMERPFSVYTNTVEDPIGSSKNLYVAGKWGNRMLVQPTGLAGILGCLLVEPRSALVRSCTLQFIDQFGLKQTVTTMIHSYATARKEGILTSRILGADTIDGRDTIVYDATITEPKPTGRFEFPHVRVWVDRQWLLPIAVDTWDAEGVQRGHYRYADVDFKANLTDKDFLPEANGMKLPRMASPVPR